MWRFNPLSGFCINPIYYRHRIYPVVYRPSGHSWHRHITVGWSIWSKRSCCTCRCGNFGYAIIAFVTTITIATATAVVAIVLIIEILKRHVRLGVLELILIHQVFQLQHTLARFFVFFQIITQVRRTLFWSRCSHNVLNHFLYLRRVSVIKTATGVKLVAGAGLITTVTKTHVLPIVRAVLLIHLIFFVGHCCHTLLR